MSNEFVKEFKLAGPQGDGHHAYVNRMGAFLGPGVPLLGRDSFGRWQPRPRPVLEKLLGAGYGVSVDLGWRMDRLASVARALNKGDLGLASIALVHAELPAVPDSEAARRVAEYDGRLAKYNPDWPEEPRDDFGRWTDEGNGPTSAGLLLAGSSPEDIQAKKQKFVDAHLADAQGGADQLGIPVENILGLAALESGWGGSSFALNGNNFFGLYYPAPYATDKQAAQSGWPVLATFASFADGLQSFVDKYGHLVQGVSDPVAFATALQQSGAFGIDPNTGMPVSTYVPDLGSVIRGLRPYVTPQSP